MKFKKGDIVVIIKSGASAASRKNFGKVFKIDKVTKHHTGIDVISSGPECGGYWADELALSTKIQRAMCDKV